MAQEAKDCGRLGIIAPFLWTTVAGDARGTGSRAVRAVQGIELGGARDHALAGVRNLKDLQVFAGACGGPIDPSWSRQTFYKALNAADIPRVRFHDLQHTAATFLLI